MSKELVHTNTVEPKLPHPPNWSSYFRMGSHTLWYFNIASENGSFIVYVPIVNGDFPQDR